ncbi:GAF and ANTAR domain-containing protein [Sinomonas terrae]|uniref:GAF and ANTAR domain-containing protein n=1 Tax=Sinomonas terrae TaxID=2908838 RepID=A0ABS9U5E8_9MICC|nr:GAF and ANTAR domain-containing protein [Sinomonas terrae]MCH6471791.1 GAF and ANTAR domain-containing protein [Sinomonas terrae]HKU09882.1 GAF and ANTAR domain-containing protein [Sinomonas sp.]
MSDEHSLSELQNLLLDSPDIKTFLTSLSSAAARKLSSDFPVHCSVTVGKDGRPMTLGLSDQEALELDKIQYSSLEGPCMEALRTGQVFDIRDMQSEERWPRYVEAMRESEIRSVLGVPIPLRGEASASLNSYAETPGSFGGETRQAALSFAEFASTSVTLALRITAESERASDLEAALESRTAINLAAGIIMAQSRCTSQEAMEILKRASNQRNVKVRDIASSILQRFDDPTPDTHFT